MKVVDFDGTVLDATISVQPPEQGVVIPGRTFPVVLSEVEDVNAFRQEISRHGRKIGQSPEKAFKGGGSSRRLKLFLKGVPMDQAILERLLEGEGIEADT